MSFERDSNVDHKYYSEQNVQYEERIREKKAKPEQIIHVWMYLCHCRRFIQLLLLFFFLDSAFSSILSSNKYILSPSANNAYINRPTTTDPREQSMRDMILERYDFGEKKNAAHSTQEILLQCIVFSFWCAAVSASNLNTSSAKMYLHYTVVILNTSFIKLSGYALCESVGRSVGHSFNFLGSLIPAIFFSLWFFLFCCSR